MKTFFVLLMAISLIQIDISAQKDSTSFYGHRGCRGLYPENTLEAFEHAIDLGVDGIEWDVIVSKDKKLIISHEPFLDASYCFNKEGKEISASEGKKVNFYELTAEEIQQFDCGSKVNSKFPDQLMIKTYKPTVQEAFEKLNLKDVTILFEIKSERSDYSIYQPEPKEYAKLIAAEIEDFEFKANIIFMCFDGNLLDELHQILPDYRYVYLTYKPFTSVKTFLKQISFTPYALGMYHPTIRKRDVKLLGNQGIKTFAWTVNKPEHSNKLMRYGVSGIITDYPDSVKRTTHPVDNQK
ncbi:MAG: hypothetical protein H6599_11270 [Flavobacteriales bacterium]|nr:hypothetical protein [Flavobacteriales bacterium]